MKKSIVLLVATIGILLMLLNTKTNWLPNTSGNVKVIAHFDRSIISGTTLTNLTKELKSKKVRKLLERFNIEYTRAVFRNRYDSNGEMLNSLSKMKNLHFLEGWQEIRIAKKKSTRFVSLLKKQVGIKEVFIERSIGLKPLMSANDPYYENHSQWHLNSYSNPLADIDAVAAWNINRGRNDVIIAVVDGGVDYNHQDLDPGDRSRIIAGYDFGDFDSDPMDDLPSYGYSYGDHGTRIAGTIGALTNNGTGVAGIMWNCKIMPIKVVSSFQLRGPFGGTIFDFSQIALPSVTAMGINYAVTNNAHVINLSQGISGLGYSLSVVTGELSILYDAILDAYDNNVVVVAAMGNEHNQGNPIEYPAGFFEVIAVGETNNLLERVSTSNSGPNIDVSAPGDFITTSRNNNYQNLSGTSAATPVVSGVAGLIISQGMDRGMNLTNDDVKHILEQTADDITAYGIGYDEDTGFGKINAFKALSLLASPNILIHGSSLGGAATEISTLNPWIYLGSGSKWGLTPGSYYGVSQYSITKHIDFPTAFCSAPKVWLREKESICLSFANSNLGYPWAQISNISPSGFDVTFAAYYVRYNYIGQAINKWVPANLSNVKVEYTAVGEQNIAATAGPINGPDYVCSSGSSFSVQNLPLGCSITWVAGPYLSMISQQGSNPCTFNANGNGPSWIRAIITPPCGSDVTLENKTVWVGVPGVPTVTPSGYPTIIMGIYSPLDVSILTSPGANFWDASWSSSGSISTTCSCGSGGSFFSLAPGTGYFSVNTFNTCGNSPAHQGEVWVNEYDMNSIVPVDAEISWSISPNPASSYVDIIIDNRNSNFMLNNYKIEFYDYFSRLVKTTKSSDNKNRIYLNNLHSGQYVVRLTIKDKKYQKVLVVQR